MTLVEVMVALTLLALLSVGIVTAFRLGERTYRTLTVAVVADRDLLTTQRFLRQILESTYPFQQPAAARVVAFGLEGSATQLAVTAPMPDSDGARGNYRYVLELQPDGRGLNRLRVRWSLDRKGTSAGSSTASAGDPHEEVLLEGIRSIDWAYLKRAESNAPGVGDERQWLSEWTGSKRPPALIRLRVVFPAGDRRHWPELLVVPRVTDDSNCQFDVVSQACREA
jgi:general secretion pathway protein J